MPESLTVHHVEQMPFDQLVELYQASMLPENAGKISAEVWDAITLRTTAVAAAFERAFATHDQRSRETPNA